MTFMVSTLKILFENHMPFPNQNVCHHDRPSSKSRMSLPSHAQQHYNLLKKYVFLNNKEMKAPQQESSVEKTPWWLQRDEDGKSEA